MAEGGGNGKVSIFQSDWIKILTLLGGLVVTLFTIGTWWGETQTELRSIGGTVTRLNTNLETFAQRYREMERTVDGHEYRLKALETRRDEEGGGHVGGTRR